MAASYFVTCSVTLILGDIASDLPFADRSVEIGPTGLRNPAV